MRSQDCSGDVCSGRAPGSPDPYPEDRANPQLAGLSSKVILIDNDDIIIIIIVIILVTIILSLKAGSSVRDLENRIAIRQKSPQGPSVWRGSIVL